MRKILPVGLLLLLFAFFFAFPEKSAAQSCESDCTLEAFRACNIDGEVNAQCMANYQIKSSATTWICSILGGDECERAGEVSYEGSLYGIIHKGVIVLYAKPAADTISYIADVGNRAGIISKAYAQERGVGFSGLAPMLDIWRSFRNIAYAFLIIAMVVIGFMIMFRRKIDPRTVMTVQNALPRIITTLLLVTFSYAIVGIMIDLMYLFIGVSFVALGAIDASAGLGAISSSAYPDIIGDLFRLGVTGETLDSMGQIFGGVGTTAVVTASSIGAFAGAIVGNGIGGTILGFFKGGLAGGAIVAAIPLLFIALTVLFAALRIFFMLIGAYIQVLISVIFGPIQIMLGAIPGNNTFGNWFRNLTANLSVFAVTAVFIALGMRLTFLVNTNAKGNLWAPPGLAGNVGEGVAGLIGLGFALIIPSFAGAIKEWLKAKPTVNAGPSMFLRPLGSIIGAGHQTVTMMHGWGRFREAKGK